MRGLIGVLFTGVVALVAGAIGFQAGIASNIGAAGGRRLPRGRDPRPRLPVLPVLHRVPAVRHRRPAAEPGPTGRWVAPAAGAGAGRSRTAIRGASGWSTPTAACTRRSPLRPGPRAPPRRRQPRTDQPREPADHAPQRRAGILARRCQPVSGACMRTILVVEDEPQIAGIVRDYLEHAGFAVIAAGDGAAALALVRARRPDALVLDLGLPRRRWPRRHPRRPPRLARADPHPVRARRRDGPRRRPGTRRR